MKKYIFLMFGCAFGFILSRAGATTYDFYAKLFLFQDLQLLWVIVTAGSVGALGVFVLRSLKAHSVFDSEPISFKGKPYNPKLIPGSILFGMGWGLAAACPGTVLAMLGEGKLAAFFPVLGIALGTYLYGWQVSRSREDVRLRPETSMTEAS